MSTVRRARAPKYAPGMVFGELTLVEYVEPDKSGARAMFSCSCGTSKVLRLGNVVGAGHPQPTRNCHGVPHRKYVETPTYSGWHQRLRARYGVASTLPCVQCGHVGIGNQWSYDGGGLDRITQLTGKDRGRLYVLDASFYQVRCREHHHRFDRKLREWSPNGDPNLIPVAMHEARTG